MQDTSWNMQAYQIFQPHRSQDFGKTLLLSSRSTYHLNHQDFMEIAGNTGTHTILSLKIVRYP